MTSENSSPCCDSSLFPGPFPYSGGEGEGKGPGNEDGCDYISVRHNIGIQYLAFIAYLMVVRQLGQQEFSAPVAMNMSEDEGRQQNYCATAPAEKRPLFPVG